MQTNLRLTKNLSFCDVQPFCILHSSTEIFLLVTNSSAHLIKFLGTSIKLSVKNKITPNTVSKRT